MLSTETDQPAPPEPQTPADATAPKQPVPRSRRRALLAVGAIGALLLLVWLGDALSGIVPAKPYHAAIQSAGPYYVTLALNSTQPTAGKPVQAQLQITNAAHQPVHDAVVTYQWTMVTMDMGTTKGLAQGGAQPGSYRATVTAIMGGYWRLTITVHTPTLPDGNTSFDVPIHG